VTGDLFDLSGRIALVTGSSRGIGFALARGLARAGAEVVIHATSPLSLESAAAELADEGLSVHARAFDVTSPAEVSQGIEGIEDEIGPIAILVNNVGMQHRTALEDFPYDMWQRLLDVNLTSAFLVGQAVGRKMIPRGHGKIINILSIQSEIARPNIAPYSSTKGGLQMLTRSMCAEWAKHGIQANGLAPGYFVTPLTQALKDDPAFDAWIRGRTPAGRWGEMDDLVGTAVFLASRGSDFVNGQTIFVDGGMSVVL
jgi:gluconate 5-dehydrogenase